MHDLGLDTHQAIVLRPALRGVDTAASIRILALLGLDW